MTSAPVSASVKSYFTETPQTNASTNGKDVDNSFSDVLKNQTGETNKAEPERDVASPKRVDGRTDRISEKPASIKEKNDADVTPEEAIEQAEKVAEEVAAEMVTQAAEVLGIPEEEVISLLEELGMGTEDLLTTEGLQALVLAAAGEQDASSFMTDENLFSNFQSLQKSLEQVVSEVAEATGLEEAEVKDIFAKFAEQTGTLTDTVEAEMSVAEDMGDVKVTETEEEETVNVSEETEGTDLKAGVPDGTEIMLERSLTDKDGGNTNQFNQDANPFAQTQTTVQNMAETIQNVNGVTGYMDTDTEMIMRQITDYMRGNVADGVSELEMQLHPESLGNLHVKLVAKEGMVTAQFLTENETVKSVLENQMVQLKETFKEQGVTVETIEVEVQTNGFEHSLGQQGGQQTASEDRQPERARTRRINLNDLEIEELELTEEEQLAAEMMKENGNTVDYTA